MDLILMGKQDARRLGVVQAAIQGKVTNREGAEELTRVQLAGGEAGWHPRDAAFRREQQFSSSHPWSDREARV